ncbi:MAG: aminotransferase class I/II-fold pyridoxal phosphate-dependent enzyme [Bacillota bacterium]
MPFRPSSRLQALPSHFFARIVRTAREMAAAGHDVINLGQGNPDLPTPPHIVERLVAAARDPRTHGYSPFDGLPELKEAIAAWYRRRFGVEVDPHREVAILIGAKVGLQEISLCLLEPGDVALVPDPGYPDYWSGIALAGARLHPLPLRPENGFVPDFAEVPPAVAEKVRLVFLNSPANPTGAVYPPEAVQEAIAFAQRYGAALAFDAAYLDLVYDGREPMSFLQFPGAREVGVEFHTLSKSFNMAGWRIAFCAGNPDLIAQLNLLQDHLHCSQFPAIQLAAAAALLGPYEPVEALRDEYRRRRDAFVAACRRIGWEVPPPAGSFFVWCPVPAGMTAADFADRVLREAHTVVAPGTAFGAHGEGYVRVSLTAPVERLEEAAERIGRLGLFRPLP